MKPIGGKKILDKTYKPASANTQGLNRQIYDAKSIV